MQALPSADRGIEARSSPRTNLFLAAVLRGPKYSAPVKLRNMSSTGALVEAAAIPPVKSEVRLVRGSLMVPASVVWSTEGRCGLRFSSLVSVQEWMAPPANREQERVDEAVRLIKSGAIPFPPAPGPEIANQAQFGSDLRSIARLLELLAEHLVSNEETVLAHGDELQNLDVAVQTLNAVASSLADDADEPSMVTRIDNLRASYRRALERSC
jgi:hypothetical protein